MFSNFCNQVTESDAVDVVETAIKHHTSDVTTKAMALISLLKIIKDLISFPFLFRVCQLLARLIMSSQLILDFVLY